MTLRIDLTGQRFGRLVALDVHHISSKRSACWRCRCDCGNEAVVDTANLRYGHTQSCGCLWRETMRKHGHSPRSGSSRTYKSWSMMLRRTTDPNHARWADWGGRGITVCDRWREFKNFLADMGERPPGTTLDRIDNDRGYEPDNCRWATPSQQQRNSRRAKVTEAMAAEIRSLYATGAYTHRSLASQYGVSHTAIADAIRSG